jgi:hypothetical protein
VGRDVLINPNPHPSPRSAHANIPGLPANASPAAYQLFPSRDSNGDAGSKLHTKPGAHPYLHPAPDPCTVPEHIIGVRQADGKDEFYNRVTNETFGVRGVNYDHVSHGGSCATQLLKVGVHDNARTRLDFEQFASYGYNTVRVFLDHCNPGVRCIDPPAPSRSYDKHGTALKT